MTRRLGRAAPARVQQEYESHQRQIVAQALSEGFEDSNRKLASLTGLDLATLGYQM